jgi:chemotaxis protein CheC
MYCANTALSKLSIDTQCYTDDQNDALQEVMNIAMGQAGDALARILGHFVQLSVPRMRSVTADNVTDTINWLIDTTQDVSAVRQAFANGLHGEAIVIFAQSGANNLADLMGYEAALDRSNKQELLLEVGNLLVGAIVNGIAETLETELSFSAPSLIAEQQPLTKILVPEQMAWSQALLMEVNFTVEERDFKCHLLMFISEDSIPTLAKILDHFIDGL